MKKKKIKKHLHDLKNAPGTRRPDPGPHMNQLYIHSISVTMQRKLTESCQR